MLFAIIEMQKFLLFHLMSFNSILTWMFNSSNQTNSRRSRTLLQGMSFLPMSMSQALPKKFYCPTLLKNSWNECRIRNIVDPCCVSCFILVWEFLHLKSYKHIPSQKIRNLLSNIRNAVNNVTSSIVFMAWDAPWTPFWVSLIDYFLIKGKLWEKSDDESASLF